MPSVRALRHRGEHIMVFFVFLVGGVVVVLLVALVLQFVMVMVFLIVSTFFELLPGGVAVVATGVSWRTSANTWSQT